MPNFSVLKSEAGFIIQARGTALKTPAANDYVLPAERLAKAIADEWESQDPKKIKPETMPLTKFAATAIDIIAQKRSKIIAQLTSYAGSDLLCHWASSPEDLVERQCKHWNPYLEWIEKQTGAVLKTGAGVLPLAQDIKALSALQNFVESYDDCRLVALQTATETTGSLVLGLALVERFKSADEIFMAAEVESHFQTERWGDDPLVTARYASIQNDLKTCVVWLDLLRVS